MPEKLKTRKDENGDWWFESPDKDWGEWLGPYDTKAEMLEDKSGVERTIETKTWKDIVNK